MSYNDPCVSAAAQREKFPIGMGYVPIQAWETPYPADRALMHGTIFPSLDYPFEMRGCR